MASEIRANSITSRAGLSTVTMTDSGPMFSGITTFVDNSGFTFGVGGGTSIFTPATNILTLGTNNTEKVRIDANGNANITGVTTASNFKTGSSNLHSTGLTVGNALVHSTGINVGTGATVHSPASNVLTLGTNSNERLRIISDGKIGINCTPASQFQVKIGTNQNIAFNTNGSNSRISAYNDAANASVPLVINGADLRFTISDTEKLRIGSSGQIGLSGANYGSSGQVLTSAGSGSAVTWSTISGTTINNNADNRVITGSGTANTLNGESNLSFNGSLLDVSGSARANNFYLRANGSAPTADASIFRPADNTLALATASTERLRIDSSGRTLINTTAVTNTNDALTVKRAASGFTEMSMTVDANTATGTHANAFVFTKSKNTYWNGLGFQSSHGHIGAIVGKRDSAGGDADQKIRIEIGGTGINASEEKTWDFLNTGDLSISDGNLVVASGHGIDFSATSNSGSGTNSELFDDYEEGSWVPGMAFGGTDTGISYSSRSGSYVKIGRYVYCVGQLDLSSRGSSTGAVSYTHLTLPTSDLV